RRAGDRRPAYVQLRRSNPPRRRRGRRRAGARCAAGDGASGGAAGGRPSARADERSGTGALRRASRRDGAASGGVPATAPLGLQRAVYFCEVFIAERSRGGLELQVIDDRVVARDGEIAPRLEELLLGVQYVDVDAHAQLVAELVRVERALLRDARLIDFSEL